MSDGTPVRWRVDIEGVPGGLYESRVAAAYALRAVRSAGKRARLVRVTTVSRRWRVGGEECLVQREFYCAGWSWSAVGVVGMRQTYDEAVEAAERDARGQMVRGRR